MRLVVTPDRAVLHCKPEPAVIAAAAGLEGRRRWTSEGLAFEPSAFNLEIVRGLKPTEDGPGLVSEWEGYAGAYEPKTRPFPHQERARAALKPTFALFMEQGTGKSKVAIDFAGELHAAGKVDAVLVVSKKGVHRQWLAEQVPRHFGHERWDGAAWPFKAVPPALLARDGRLKWLAINYDGAKAPLGRAAVEEFLAAHAGRALIVADESQDIKNARSERHAALTRFKEVARSPYRMILTGTPIAKDLTDEWSQLKWLNEDILGVRYVTTFRARYCRMGGFEGREVVGHQNVEEFRAKTAPFTFRVTKEEIGLMPPIFEEWPFDLLPAQRKLIRQVKDEMLAELADGRLLSIANAAVGFGKIQQISNGFLMDDSGVAHRVVPRDKDPRLEALEEYLGSREGEKVIVWARYRADIAEISLRLRELGLEGVEYHGGTSDAERAANVRSFLDPGGARVFVGNPQSGGAGLNLQGLCRNALYYSNGWNAVDRWQSQARIDRIGSKGASIYTDLVARGGIDRAVLARLKKRKSISDLGIGDVREILEEVT